MGKILVNVVFFVFLVTELLAQFDAGMISYTFNDPSRTRDIATEIYYPADEEGENVAIAEGTFPVVVFGHGFSMSGDAYTGYWENILTENCYIVVFVNTEASLTVDHESYALDLAFVAEEMLGNAPAPMTNGINGKVALLGHSMGGGASMAAAKNNTTITTVITMGAAETTAPASAIAAAADVLVPTLFIAGQDDCVVISTMSAGGPLDIFNAFNASNTFRAYVEIANGTHCDFTNGDGAFPLITPAGNCYFGEAGCPTGIGLDLQHEYTENVLIPWLNYYLKNMPDALSSFYEAVGNETIYSDYREAPMTSINEQFESEFSVYPNPSNGQFILNIDPKLSGQATLTVFDSNGRIVSQKAVLLDNQVPVSIENLSGIYILQISVEDEILNKKISIIE